MRLVFAALSTDTHRHNTRTDPMWMRKLVPNAAPAVAATVVTTLLLWSNTLGMTHAHEVRGGSISRVQEEFGVMIPSSEQQRHRQVVSFYNIPSQGHGHRRIVERKEEEEEEEEEELESFLWDNDDMDVYYVDFATNERTRQEVRYMVSDEMGSRNRNRRHLEDKNGNVPKPRPKPVGQVTATAAVTNDFNNDNNNNSNNNMMMMPYGEYKVILPNGTDQFVTYSPTSDAGIQAIMAAWSTKIHSMEEQQQQQQGTGHGRHERDRTLQWDDKVPALGSIHPSGSYRLNRPDGSYHIVTYHVVRMDHDNFP